MVDHCDPQLSFLLDAVSGGIQEDSEKALADIEESNFYGIESTSKKAKESAKSKPGQTIVQVIIQATSEVDKLEQSGLTIRSQIGDIITGVIALERLEDLAAVEGVELIEGAREMVAELDLAIADTRVNLVQQGPPGRRGSGVIVGVVDSGCDFTHPCFRNDDGTSRILFIWDQTLTRTSTEAAPAGFAYGVEYTNAQINAALTQANPFAQVRSRDPDKHGTHVAGIAAGNGRASSSSQPAFRFIGVAPEADLIIVKVGGSGSEGLGTSANALDAVNYCYQRAQSNGNRACVVNMSLGDNLGPHDGTSLLERGLDNLLGPQRRAFVKSAGNVGDARHHAGGTVPSGGMVSVGFNQPSGNTTPDTLDFWYGGSNVFRAEVIDSAGNSTGLVNVGAVANVTLAGGNTVRIDHRNNDPFNGDKRIFINITRGSATQIRPGDWTVKLQSVSSAGGGRFDGWIQRHRRFNQRPTFNAPFESNDRSISTPGTAKKVITAANYISRGAGVDGLTASSSRGPTRDGRLAPTVAAPGTNVFSANAEYDNIEPRQNPYRSDTGTSMSAPHITGIIALMFQKNPNRTQEQIRECLTSTARQDGFTGPVPNTAWGAGKVDAQAAVNCVPALDITPPLLLTRVEPRCRLQTVVQPQCTQLVTRVPRCLQLTRVPSECVVSSRVVGCIPSAVAVRCPSLVDGCPSTPGGCDLRTVVINPGTVVTNPGTTNTPSLNMPGFRAIGTAPFSQLSPEMEALAAEIARQVWETLSVAWTSEQPEAAAETIPEQGYFEYDDSWFDYDESNS
jgi:subtilisin family serine protease